MTAKPDATTVRKALPPAFLEFDKLPDAANVRDDVVAALWCCTTPTVWRLVKEGRLPAPRKLGPRTTVWNVGELRRALRAPLSPVGK